LVREISSLQRTVDGTLWFGDEFGPFLLHTDLTGKVLEPPSACNISWSFFVALAPQTRPSKLVLYTPRWPFPPQAASSLSISTIN
jgi:hypothetical protein